MIGAFIEPIEQRQHLSASIPRFDHVVIVVEENKAYGQIIGSSKAPFINSLARSGAVLTGRTPWLIPASPTIWRYYRVQRRASPPTTIRASYSAPNLAQELAEQHLSSAGYAVRWPQAQSVAGFFQRAQVGEQVNGQLPHRFLRPAHRQASSPRIERMTCTMGRSSRETRGSRTIWVRMRSGPETHNSLLIVTFDEDDDAHGNHIATIFSGTMYNRASMR